MSLLAPFANLAWGLTNAPAHAAFIMALENPRPQQDRILRGYVKRNADTQFGRDHRFDRIGSADDFRRRVPLRVYDDFSPYVDRIAAGEQNILTFDRVKRLATSSGSTRAAKFIPYTSSLQNEFNRAIGPWIVDLFLGDPDLAAGCAYWSISPIAQRTDEPPSAVPIGFEEDSAYLGGIRKHLVDAVMAVPGEVRYCGIDAFRYVTLRFLLARRDLRLISVWHPSFLQLLLESAASRWDELLEDIARGTLTPGIPVCIDTRKKLAASLRPNRNRAAELRALGSGHWPAIWPNLRLISAWGSAHAAGAAIEMRRIFPGVRFQEKGLLATEAFVTIPFRGHWPLAIRSHHFEFLDDGGRSFLTDELRYGAEYTVVVTTAGGLYRYRLGDRVRVDGFLGRTPSLRFVGRHDDVVDRFGEKLSEGFVARVLSGLWAEPPAFAMLVPDGDSGPRYTLLVESRSPLPADLACRLDAALRDNPHYAYCRDLGQLGMPRVFVVRDRAYPIYAATLAEMGMRVGDLKPTALSRHAWWTSKFAGDYL